MGSDLKNRTAKGISWGFIDNLCNTGIMAVVNIILANILSPEQFGVVAMSSIFITLANSLVDSGFAGALTRKKECTPSDCSTVFIFNLAVSILLYLLLYFLAPVISRYFDEPILIDIIRILSLTLVINALSIVQRVLLIRKIDFKTQAIISLVSSFLSGGAALYLALKGYGVWALVVLQILRQGINTFLLWVTSKWFPSLLFSTRSFKEMFSFGSRLLVTSLISVIWNEIYAFIIGKSYSASVLGQYSRAEKFKSMVTSNISIVIQRVSYPVLSSLADDPTRELRAYKRVLRTTVLISFTAVLGLCAASESIVLTLVGEQWIESIKYLRILCFSGLFIPIQMISANVINALGRSDITLRLEIIKTVLAIIPVLLGIFINVEALLYGMIFISVISFVFHSYYVYKVLNYNIVDQIKDIFPFFALSLLMSAVVFAVSFLDLPHLGALVLELFTGGAVTIVNYTLLYKSEEFDDICNQIFKILRIK